MKDFNTEPPPMDHDVLFAWKWKDTNVIEYAVGFFTIRPEGYKVIHCGTRNLVEGMSLDQVNLFWTELPSLP